MPDVTVKTIRIVLKKLHAQLGPVSKERLESELGVTDNYARKRLRDALKQMLRKGELTQYDDGSYRFVVEASPPSSSEEQWERIYRAVWAAKGVFDIKHISLISVVQEVKAKRDINKLIGLGFISAIKAENGIIYTGTQLLRDTPEVPPMPKIAKGVKTAMREAREATAELNRLFLTMEDTAGARKLIKRQLDILNAEFK